MPDCHFCGHRTGSQWAVTSCTGDPRDTNSWRRHVLSICPRCNRDLRKGGREGRKLRATGVIWYAGHNVGILESRGAGRPR